MSIASICGNCTGSIRQHRAKSSSKTIAADAQRDGYIRHVGLSEVSVGDIEEAQQYFPVVTVQNQYNLVDRKSEVVLDYCEAHNIGFIPWFPLAAGDLAKSGSVLVADRASVWAQRRRKSHLPGRSSAHR